MFPVYHRFWKPKLQQSLGCFLLIIDKIILKVWNNDLIVKTQPFMNMQAERIPYRAILHSIDVQ